MEWEYGEYILYLIYLTQVMWKICLLFFMVDIIENLLYLKLEEMEGT